MKIDELPWQRGSPYWDFTELSPSVRVFRRSQLVDGGIPSAFAPGDYVFMGTNHPPQVHIKAEDKLIAQALVIEYLKGNEKAA